jgi:AcrR family transcriptional regulator
MTTTAGPQPAADAVREARGPGRPRNRDTDIAILDAAVDELAERGYLSLSMEAIAERAGVAKTTVYRRWPNKQALVSDALAWLKGPLVEVPGKTVRDDLVHLVEAARLTWQDSRHGRVMRRLAAEGADHPELYADYRERVLRARQLAMITVLRRGVDNGEIRSDVDLDRVRELLISPVVAAGMTLRKLTSAEVEFFVDTVLAGLRP